MEKPKCHSEDIQDKSKDDDDNDHEESEIIQAEPEENIEDEDEMAGNSIIVEKRVGNVSMSSLQNQTFLTKKACVVKIDNCHYTIVANTSNRSQGSQDKGSDKVKSPKSPKTPRTPQGGEKKKLADSTYFTGSELDMENVFKKLKELHSKINKGVAINVTELKRTLEFAIGVAEKANLAQQSAVALPKGNVFESDSVPNQVRDWLTMTFTRPSTVARDENEDRNRFKSVANAIRAGISVEKLLKTHFTKSEISRIVFHQLAKIDDWTFDIFELNDAATKSQGFRHVARTLLNKYEFTNKFKIPINVMDNFILMVEEGYRKHTNPYHNELHAADVTQTVSCIITQTDLKSYMTDIEVFSTIFAALIHDFEHTGTTNTFHINARTDLAMLYNDRAVLENFHVSQVFRKMSQDENINIVAKLNHAEYNEFRYSVVDIVLATDMSYHFQQLKHLKASFVPPDMSLTMLQLVCVTVHFSDISHPTKSWHVHSNWAKRLFDEFFIQGDRELDLKLPISPLCDRHHTMIPESQIGFIDFIIYPTMNQIFEVIPVAINMRSEDGNLDLKKPLQEGIAKFKEEIEFSMMKNKTKWVEESKNQ